MYNYFEKFTSLEPELEYQMLKICSLLQRDSAVFLNKSRIEEWYKVMTYAWVIVLYAQ
jgi:hypothetical protein